MPARRRHSWYPDPARDVVIDAAILKALAHPMRVRLVGLLRSDGPATATSLATRLGVNSGATSYHLRQLADAGLVTEDDTRGNARDRWWRAVHRGSYLDNTDLIRQEPELAGAFLHSVMQANFDRAARAIDELPTLPRAWSDASDFSDFTFQLTARQLKELREELYEVLDRYRTEPSDEQPRNSRKVSVQLQAFPVSGERHEIPPVQ
ncbi:MAG: putative transcriptional regulator [Frankiales bacterium]|nr:putative transcriptional regulator [Frankiales bacterium]